MRGVSKRAFLEIIKAALALGKSLTLGATHAIKKGGLLPEGTFQPNIPYSHREPFMSG
jgi:hypothetical protein